MKFKQVHEITLQNEVFELPENTPAYEKFHRICLYAGLAENVATHNAKTKAFLKGLYSYKDKSPVSRYIINELAGPLYYRPTFLMGTHKREAEKKNDASSVYTFSQSELYDKKLLSVIFNFLGDRESFVHTESKEECEESPEERKEREEAEVSANKWKLTLHS